MSFKGRAIRSSMTVGILLAGIGVGVTAHGWWHGRHYHPGHEFVYVLEGSGALDLEGRPGQRPQAGTVSYVPPGKVDAGRNASPTEKPISVELS